MILYWKSVVEKLRNETLAYISKHNLTGRHVAHFLLSVEWWVQTYGRMKKRYAESVWLQSHIVSWPDRTLEQVLAKIDIYNNDDDCVGIIIQLPLAKHLQPHYAEIVTRVIPSKDVDGLWGVLTGLSQMGKFDFLPATPKACIEMLAHYDLDIYRWKTCVVIWQSNLIGKPLCAELMSRGATVISLNSKSDASIREHALAHADIVFSATGVKHLVSPSTVWITADSPSDALGWRIYIDIWRWSDEEGPHGDMDRKWLASYGATVTPVPGGIWPITVASLFHNVKVVHHLSVTSQV